MKPALKRNLRRTISATLATLLATGLVAPALAARYSGAEVYDHVLAKLVAEQYPEVVYLPRCEELGGDRVPKMAVIQDSLARMEEKNGAYDYVMDLDITSPLRTAQDIKNAFELAESRQDLDFSEHSANPTKKINFIAKYR